MPSLPPFGRAISVALLVLWALLAVTPASAQSRTFYLDRAQISGAPDDGFMVWRPYMHARTRFYGNFALGYTLNPLKKSNVTDNGRVQERIETLVQHQLISYLQVGTEVASRVGFNIALPIAVFEAGGADPSAEGVGNGIAMQTAAVQDMRFDVRVKTYESDNGLFRIGGAGVLWVPTGNANSFGSDGQATGAILGNMEFDFGTFLLSGMLGPHFRPDLGIGGDAGVLGITDELRYAGGAYLVLRQGRVRLGGELWGTTGLGNNSRGDNTTFSGRNTDLEWLAQAKFTFGKDQRAYANFGGGTQLATGYGSPNVRLLASVGMYTELVDFNPNSPAGKHRKHDAADDHELDTDGDGYPDSIDACPTVPEDGRAPDASDGCPGASDRDKDGILDDQDKCPDDPEDFDNVQDGDGCPEVDADNDKVLDVEDHCPTEPGPRSKIAEKNGCPSLTKVTESGEVELIEPIQFDTGKATIKRVSFPIIDEVVTLLRSRPEMRLGVYGHTDNRGGAAMNLKLSKDRAASVRKYIIEKGIAEGRLESEGFGQTKPVADNGTNEGRARNRRVEFKILGGDD